MINTRNLIVVIRCLRSNHTFLTAPVQEKYASPEQGGKKKQKNKKPRLQLWQSQAYACWCDELKNQTLVSAFFFVVYADLSAICTAK